MNTLVCPGERVLAWNSRRALRERGDPSMSHGDYWDEATVVTVSTRVRDYNNNPRRDLCADLLFDGEDTVSRCHFRAFVRKLSNG